MIFNNLNEKSKFKEQNFEFLKKRTCCFPHPGKGPKLPKVTRKHPLHNKQTCALRLTAGKIIDFPSFCFDYKKVLRKQTAAVRPSVATSGEIVS